MVKIELTPGKECYYDGYMVNALDTIIYNVRDDWDFIILVTGDRMVRIGKSVLGQQIGAYIASKLGTPFSLDNIFFSSKDMMKKAKKFPPHSVIVYDEGREGLAASKSSLQLQHDLLDFFNECGQLNHVFIIILPDFFGLKEEIAVGRSEYLVNVYRKEVKEFKKLYNKTEDVPVVRFERGYFEFFNKKNKQELYDISKSTRKKNYGLIPANFRGRFTNTYVVDESEYRKMKRDALMRFMEGKEEEKPAVTDEMIQKQLFERLINSELPIPNNQKAQLLGIAEKTYYEWIKKYRNSLLNSEIS